MSKYGKQMAAAAVVGLVIMKMAGKGRRSPQASPSVSYSPGTSSGYAQSASATRSSPTPAGYRGTDPRDETTRTIITNNTDFITHLARNPW